MKYKKYIIAFTEYMMTDFQYTCNICLPSTTNTYYLHQTYIQNHENNIGADFES